MNNLFKSQLDDEITVSVYKGVRLHTDPSHKRGTCAVTVNEQPLLLLKDKDSVEWGYRGSAPTNLSKSILNDLLDPEEITPDLIVAFRDYFLATLPFDGWQIDENVILGWVDLYKQHYGKDKKKDAKLTKSN